MACACVVALVAGALAAPRATLAQDAPPTTATAPPPAIPSPAQAAAAQPPERPGRARLEWGDRPRFGVGEYVTTGVAVAGALALRFSGATRQGTWVRVDRLDAAARNGFRSRRSSGRTAADRASTGLLWTLQLYPFVVDAGVAALAVHRSPDVALQMALIDAQAFALTSFVTVAIKGIAHRQRPYGVDCPPSSTQAECLSGGRYSSFFSGHTSTAFTGAGLVCAHHQGLALYGNRAADLATCGAALGAATTVGMLRMVADKHYLSDVLLGAGVGLLSGFVMPKLLHYRLERAEAPAVQGTVAPMAGRDTIGLQVQGAF